MDRNPSYGHTGRGTTRSLLELVTMGDWSVSLETLHFLGLKQVGRTVPYAQDSLVLLVNVDGKKYMFIFTHSLTEM